MFASLSEKLQGIIRKLRGEARITEQNIQETLREIRIVLLEADVNFKVVKEFIDRIKAKAVGQEVMRSLTPGQQVVKIVYEELVSLLGGTQSRIAFSPRPPTIVMLVGLHGSGKTTAAAKLALYYRKDKHKPLLVAADPYRPAAIEQLKVLGDELKLPVFSLGERVKPIDICKGALERARSLGCDLVLIDTAGRLHIDGELMGELKEIKEAIHPQEILLVADAMTGQEALNIAQRFNEALGIDGVLLTKMEGDARGGAALSIKAVTGKPIKFASLGEKPEALEPFHPDRVASRILGMGDVLTLIEKAEKALDLERAKELERKFEKEAFTLEDFLEQLQQIKKMGPLDQIISLIPGLPLAKIPATLQPMEGELKKIEAIINSMTLKERRHPQIIDGSRRRRIALGSGTSVQDVNKLLKQFFQMKEMLRKVGKGFRLGKIPFR